MDLLKIANPDGIGRTTSPGAYGVSDPFSFPFVSVETVVQLHDGNLLIANDNNYPGDDARNPGTPDDTEMVIIDPDAKAPTHPHSATLIGHRGSSGTRPEHTLASYEQAILACAEFIEPDVVPTKDGYLVARHEPEISGTTDVASHPEFAARRTTKTLDGVPVTGWFTEDFTLAELKTLRAVERLPGVRPKNTAFNALYAIPTLDEVLDLARHSRTCNGGEVGVYPETKHPTYFKNLGLSTDQPVLDALQANGMDDGYPVFIQSFETTNLKQLDRRTDVPLVQLVDCAGAPFDLKSTGDPTTYADLVTRAGLRQGVEVRRRHRPVQGPADPARCPGPAAPADPGDRRRAPVRPGRPPVHLPGGEPVPAAAVPLSAPTRTPRATSKGELKAFLRAGIDGFFTDNPAIGARVVS